LVDIKNIKEVLDTGYFGLSKVDRWEKERLITPLKGQEMRKCCCLMCWNGLKKGIGKIV
jgi:hypothetical protein